MVRVHWHMSREWKECFCSGREAESGALRANLSFSSFYFQLRDTLVFTGRMNYEHKAVAPVFCRMKPEWPDDLKPCCVLLLLPQGNWNWCTHPLHPGHHWQEEYRRPKRYGTSVHRPGHHGHRCVHGPELRLPHQPGPRPRAAVLHGRGRVGRGRVQVTSRRWKHQSVITFCLPGTTDSALLHSLLYICSSVPALLTVWMNISDHVHVFQAFPKRDLGVKSSGKESMCNYMKYFMPSKWQRYVLSSLSGHLKCLQ